MSWYTFYQFAAYGVEKAGGYRNEKQNATDFRPHLAQALTTASLTTVTATSLKTPVLNNCSDNMVTVVMTKRSFMALVFKNDESRNLI